ncbi:MAG TPA: zf-TFIIB domain-containing protein [Gemmatimonadaceae bacterium]|nr:zf-TFIIB domain-containing protein [Gemmatimonadaceae bacterium]
MLNCPSCGAAAPAEATECPFCHAKLATIGCPACFGLVFLGSRFCQHCGAAVAAPQDAEDTRRRCPRGCGDMKREKLGETTLDECPECNGVWLDPDTFEHLCAQKEDTAPALFEANTAGPARDGAPDTAHVPARSRETVHYVPCPICSKIMNRTNFGRISGVIIDTCKPHGVWFDADELRRVIEFVRGGGMEKSRARELAQLQEERRLREFEQRVDAVLDVSMQPHEEITTTSTGTSLLGALLGLKVRRN